jgi:DHA2 family multidrug resistance protein
MMACGLVLMGAGGYQLSGVNLAIGEWGLAVPLAVLGAGMALAFVPMETLAFSRIPRHLLADAAGLSNVLQETGGAVGLALFTSLFLRESVSARAGVAAHLGITNPMAVQQLSSLQAHLPGGPSMASRAMALRFLGGSVARQAMELAYQHFFLLVGLLILSLLPLLLLLKVDRGASTHGELEAE